MRVAMSVSMGVHAARKLIRFPYLGFHTYSLTCCTFSGVPWFRDVTTVDRTLAQLMRSAREEGFAILAYCFMPDHVHLLAEGTSATSDLPRFVARWKQTTGHAHRSETGAALWQGGFYDHVLRAEEDWQAIVRHLIANPIRAGLVMDVRDYAHWGSGVSTREQLIETLFDRPLIVERGL